MAGCAERCSTRAVPVRRCRRPRAGGPSSARYDGAVPGTPRSAHRPDVRSAHRAAAPIGRRATHLPAPRTSRGVRCRRRVVARGRPSRALTFVGLHALQHRGQESAGIAVSDGPRLSLHKRLGLVERRLRRGDPAPARRWRRPDRRRRRRPSATPATARPARTRCRTCSRSTRDGSRRADARPQRQPDERALAARRARGAGSRVRLRLGHRGAREADRPRAGADVGPAGRPCLPPSHRRVHLHDAHRRRHGRRARPGRVSAAGPRAAARRGMGGRVGERGARRHGRALRARRRGRRGPHDHRRRRRRIRSAQARPAARAAVRLRVRLPRPARQRHRRAPAVRGAPRDGSRPRPRASGRCGPRHRRARLGDPGGHRLRRGGGAAVPRRADQVALRRADVHSAAPGGPRGGGAPEVQPAPRAAARQARRGRGRLDRARHDDRADRGDAAPRGCRRGPRSHPLARRCGTRATWASTPAGAAS